MAQDPNIYTPYQNSFGYYQINMGGEDPTAASPPTPDTSAVNAANTATVPVSNTSKNQTGYTNIVVDPGGVAARPNIPPPPTAPNTAQLQWLADGKARNLAIRNAVKDYDALYASTQANGFQAANNAGNIYANRLMQAGINPTSSGVVTGQAKMKVFDKLEDITKEKDATRLDAINKSQALSAQIAAQIAQIKLAYSKTLADYNQQTASLDLNLNEFNASQGASNFFRAQSQDLAERQFAAQLAAQGLVRNSNGTYSKIPSVADGGSLRIGGGGGGGRTGRFDPGYITNQGPLIPAVINGVEQPGNVLSAWPETWGTTTSLTSPEFL